MVYRVVLHLAVWPIINGERFTAYLPRFCALSFGRLGVLCDQLCRLLLWKHQFRGLLKQARISLPHTYEFNVIGDRNMYHVLFFQNWTGVTSQIVPTNEIASAY